MASKTTKGSKINPKMWYVYRWSSKEEREGFVSEAFKTKREAINHSGACGQFHREIKQYYTCGRTHVTKGDNILED